jgi:heme/copper-type cytochrome/quinol oxidase subunit 2
MTPLGSMMAGALPFILVVGLLALSWWTITSMWKQSKQTEEDDQPKDMSTKDYLKIAFIVIAVLVVFPRAPELIAPLLE